MKIYIERKTPVEGIKQVFTNYYPFLKIELYKMLTDRKENCIKKEALPPDCFLDKLLKVDKTIIEAGKNITVAELKSQFAVNGLHAEIFRKSGAMWVETLLTHNWTLQQQNAEAEELNKHLRPHKTLY